MLTPSYKCNAMQCQKCQKQLRPDEPVWRQQESIPPHGWTMRWSWAFFTVCIDCIKEREEDEYAFSGNRDRWTGAKTSPCDGCSRLVTIEGRFKNRCRYWACSEKCRNKAARLRKQAGAAKKRRRECPVCGETFTPRRNDAITCSPKCRQKSYRQRGKANPSPSDTPPSLTTFKLTAMSARSSPAKTF